MRLTLFLFTLFLLSAGTAQTYSSQHTHQSKRGHRSIKRKELANDIVDMSLSLKYSTEYLSKVESQRVIKELEQLVIQYKALMVHSSRPHPVKPKTPVLTFNATCEINTGGSFFNPKTKVVSTIYGKNATAYEIMADNKLTWRGKLDPTKQSQLINTSKERIGSYPVIDIYIIGTDNSRTKVFSGK